MVNPWHALMAVVAILAAAIWPGVLAWLNSRKAPTKVGTSRGPWREQRRRVREGRLDRIERTQQEHGAKIGDVAIGQTDLTPGWRR